MKKWFIFVGSIILVLITSSLILLMSPQKQRRQLSPFPTPTAFQKPSVPKEQESIGIGPGKEFIKEHEETTRRDRPDIFLSNRLPHKETTFEMVSYFSKQRSRFSFIVSIKGTDAAKSKDDVIPWMKSLGLTDNQIQFLSISYQPEVVIKLKDRLPHDGLNFSMDYEPDEDKIVVIIYKGRGAEGEKELDEYLQKQGISDRSQINNLTILYR